MTDNEPAVSALVKASTVVLLVIHARQGISISLRARFAPSTSIATAMPNLLQTRETGRVVNARATAAMQVLIVGSALLAISIIQSAHRVPWSSIAAHTRPALQMTARGRPACALVKRLSVAPLATPAQLDSWSTPRALLAAATGIATDTLTTLAFYLVARHAAAVAQRATMARRAKSAPLDILDIRAASSAAARRIAMGMR